MKWLGFEPGFLDPSYGNIRISQLLALLIIAAAVVLIIIRRTTGPAKAHYSDPIVSTKTAATDTVVPDSAEHTPQRTPQGGNTAVKPPAEEEKKEQ